MKEKLYRAFWERDHSTLIFKGVPASEVRDRLPKGARVAPDKRNTIGRLDGGDEYQFGMFEVDGKWIIVIPDFKEQATP